MSRLDQLHKEIIFWGKELHCRGLITGCTGNISARLDTERILVTAHNAYLGYLEPEEILPVTINGGPDNKEKDSKVTTELAMHLAAYEQSGVNVVIHAHPCWTTAFYAQRERLDIFSYEARLYLANIPVVPQDGPIVSDVRPVKAGLAVSNIVVLKNHGVVSVGEDFKQAFSLIEMLEENCRVNFVQRTEDRKQRTDRQNAQSITYVLFSPEHIDKIVELVNEDKYAREKGAALELTTCLAIRVDDDGRRYNFHFNKGHIDKVSRDEQAPFVVSGPLSSWEMVFRRKLDPFAAVTQNRLQLKGDMAQLSKWYAPFNRIFELWKQAPIEEG